MFVVEINVHYCIRQKFDERRVRQKLNIYSPLCLMNTEHGGEWRYPLQNMCIFSRDKLYDGHIFGNANLLAANKLFYR